MHKNIKSFGLTAVITVVLIMAYMVAPPVLQPDNYVQTGEQVEQNSDVKLVEQPDDSYMLGLSYVPYDSTPSQAEALVPAVIGAGVVAGTVGVGYGFYQGLEVSQYFKESDINASEADDVIRTDVHDASISSDGTYEGWIDTVDNNINTIEGSTLQIVNNEFIDEADNVTSESELVVGAENVASDYLWGTQTNIEETHNFHSHDLAQNQLRKLDSANYSEDYYVENADEKISVSNTTELKKALNGTSIDSNNSKVVINLQNDISIGYLSSSISNLLINMNGYTLNQTDTLNLENGNDQKITYVNGEYSPNSGGAEFSRYSNGADLVFNIFNAQIKGSDNNIALDEYQSSPQFRVYNGSDVDVSFSGAGGGVSVINNDEKNVDIRDYDVTLDPADVSSPEATVEFTQNNSTTNLTGINVSVASTYSNATEAPLQVALPYVNTGSGYQPMDYANGSKLYIDTPTSGIYDRVEPVQFGRTIDAIQTRDSRSDAVYNTVQTHAQNSWNDTISKVANDDNLSVTDYENVTEDLSIFNVDTVDVNDTDAVLSQYAGIYDSVAQPSDTRINLTNGDGTQYNGVVLFSTDMQTLMNQTSNSSELAVNDKFNASDVSRTFVVDPSNAEVYELSGDVTVDGLQLDNESVDSVDIQTFDLLSTDLSKQAQAIQESVDVTIETVDDAQSGGDITIPPILPSGNGVGTLVVLGVIVAIILRRRQN